MKEEETKKENKGRKKYALRKKSPYGQS